LPWQGKLTAPLLLLSLQELLQGSIFFPRHLRLRLRHLRLLLPL
jgi:hypothetical protein